MPNPGSPHILLIDDSEDDALLVERELRRSLPDALFHRVDDPEGMRAALDLRTWDMVICDHRMPRFDSTLALRMLREWDRETPFIIYSGSFDHQRAAAAMLAGARDFIDKRDLVRLPPVVARELADARAREARARAELSLAELAHFDPLTRLPNRGYLTEIMETALTTLAPDASPALLCLDVDRMMRINESFGYAAGDSLLRQVATRLKANAGPTVVVARLGQDKFALFSTQCADPYAARTLAERVARDLAQPFKLHGQDIFVTASIGLGFHPDHGADALALMRNVESAMASAKRKGGNRVQIYQRECNAGASRQFMLENALRHAIARDELSVAFQPVVLLDTGRVVGTEALLRWSHPELGHVPPDQFIPIAEQAGLIVEIGEWVLRQACAHTVRLHRAGFDHLYVAVNFSGCQFQSPDAAARVAAILKATGLDPQRLEVEITESVAMEDVEASIAAMRALKDIGVQIAIDDFGTGYSSLSYLRRFPLDVLKIDRSFMREVPENDENAAIVASIAALAQSLRLVLHAEGVETEAHYAYLRQLGCDRAQGFLLQPALGFDALVAALHTLDAHPFDGKAAPAVSGRERRAPRLAVMRS